MDDLATISAGPSLNAPPAGDQSRQAIESLGGYAYQIAVSALSWLDLDERECLYLEVAEDYAVVVGEVLNAVQVKNTKKSTRVTLQSKDVKRAIVSLIDLQQRNPNRTVKVQFLSTAEIGEERQLAHRPAGMGGVEYWRKVASGEDIGPLREVLLADGWPEEVHEFVQSSDDQRLLRDLVSRLEFVCAAPSRESIRQELQERLIVIAQDQFRVPATKAHQLVDVVLTRVLETALLAAPEERRLTRAALIELIGEATRVNVPWEQYEQLVATSFQGADGQGAAASPFQTSSLYRSSIDLPSPRLSIERPAECESVIQALETGPLVFLVGMSGVGKSTVAREVLERSATEYWIFDFRGCDEVAGQARLSGVLGRIADRRHAGLLLDDLDVEQGHTFPGCLGLISAALTRANKRALVTCYQAPSASVLNDAGLDASAIVEIPNFSEDDVARLVEAAGGDRALWARLAYFASYGGFPQLAQAYVSGRRIAGWPAPDPANIVEEVSSPLDIEQTKAAARRQIASELPTAARQLLYRLSIATCPLSRRTINSIAAANPPIAEAGEWLDRLSGPWIEEVDRDRYMISPLLVGSGAEQLSEAALSDMHEKLAISLLSGGSIRSSDANAIVIHGLAGKSVWPLMIVSQAVVTENAQAIESHALDFSVLSALSLDRPTFAENPAVSHLLRLAQFKVLASADGDRAGKCAGVLLAENASIQEEDLRAAQKALSLNLLLSTPGSANYLEGYIGLLLERARHVRENPELAILDDQLEVHGGAKTCGTTGLLFLLSTFGIASVERFEQIMDEIREVPTAERQQVFEYFRNAPEQWSMLVDGPWLAEHRTGAIDGPSAAERYGRIAELATTWGDDELARRCFKAQSVMLDEYSGDSHAALQVLEQAANRLGTSFSLIRARAMVMWRSGNYGEVVGLQQVVDALDSDIDPTERAYMVREAAISAGKIGDWERSAQWFSDASKLTLDSDLDELVWFSLGLKVDGAVAEVLAGRIDSGLKSLSDALDEVELNADESSLRAVYVRHVVRHCILWVQRRLCDDATGGDADAVDAVLGVCSNVDPREEIRERELAPVGGARYLLAQAEVASRSSAGILESLESKLSDGPMPFHEALLIQTRIEMLVEDGDADAIANDFEKWLAATHYLMARGRREPAGAMNPFERGTIPALTREELSSSELNEHAANFIVTACVVATLKGAKQFWKKLDAALVENHSPQYPGRAVLRNFRGELADDASLVEIAAHFAYRLDQTEDLRPLDLWVVSLRIYEFFWNSVFRSVAIPVLAAWMRSQWASVISRQRFDLRTPNLHVPEIEAALESTAAPGAFCARVVLVAAAAVGGRLGDEYRELLESRTRQ